jgi:hypothetical protein
MKSLCPESKHLEYLALLPFPPLTPTNENNATEQPLILLRRQREVTKIPPGVIARGNIDELKNLG